MPWQARLDIAGALHHIMVRGINRSPIFQDEEDKRRTLQSRAHPFKNGKHSISMVVRRLLPGYAQRFNRRHRRTGLFFENRYKSVLCEEEKYLLALGRYLHLNPGRAKIVLSLEELDRYPWGGHRAIWGNSSHCIISLQKQGT